MSENTGSRRAWKPSGDVPYSAGDGRRDAGFSRSDFLRSTLAPESLGFPRWRRLTRWSDIRRVGREGRKVRGENLELRSMASPLSHARVAIVVPRHRHTIVERNRLRRLIREHLRTTILNSLPALDIVVRALPGSYATRGVDLRSELSRLTERIPGRPH